MRSMQDNSNFTGLMVLQEKMKVMPFGDVWNEYLNRQGMIEDYLPEVHQYEKDSLEARQ